MRGCKSLALIALSSLTTAGQTNYAQYVNPFIGAEGPTPGRAFGGGDIFVGGAVPYGVVKLGIDTYETNPQMAVLNGGFTPEGNVTAVSMIHVSGTGGCPKYGVISQMPLTTTSAPVDILNNRTYWQHRVGNDTARVGYFKTDLESGVRVELSGTAHAGILQYSFPAGEKNVLVDLTHRLPSARGSSCTQRYVDSEISISDDGTEYTGYGVYEAGWNEGAPYKVYFCGQFDSAPDQAKAFNAENSTTPDMGGKRRKARSRHDTVGALFTWNDTATASTLRSRVGISFISAEKACAFKDAEVPTWELNDTVEKAVSKWNEDIFNTVRVGVGEGANTTDLTLLYSSLYFAHLMPSNRTGENPGWVSEEPYYDDFYAIWDTFRCTTSLHHLIQPKAYTEQILALIDIYRHDGFLPDGRSGNYNGLSQGGSNADNVLADAYVKGLRNGINWTDAYAAMLKDAKVIPDLRFKDKEGRAALADWKKLGYVSQDLNERCVSRTVEYSLNDFAVAQVAAGERPEDVEKYLQRSKGWQRTWDHDAASKGIEPAFKGFLTPRLSNGTFNASDYNPAQCGGCSWSAITYEATPFEYSFNVPHDMATLIEFMGGKDEFERRLDHMFKPNSSQQDLGVNGAGINTLMNIGNEPDFQTPYLYNYINKQYKSVFTTAPNGLPGNSDAGALNSWLIWQMIGLYPVVTQPIYLIGSPWFPDLNMTVNGNRTLRITAEGLGRESYYVQSVKVNGREWTKSWVGHEDVMVEGGTIEFVLGERERAWEGEGEGPGSPGGGGLGGK
ncbi:Alpha-mannosidase [Pyrenophora tritici-repentis]|nr:Alpha-mannosidase [Pyrenophora tritici-repentis]